MKTTIEISPALLAEAKRHAQAEHTTLKALIETGLRRVLADSKDDKPPFRLRDGSFHGGNGLTPEFQNAPWEKFRDAIYEGRG
ncbi:MAG: type II toxin-antitoxin system VapB family antitoxin [Alphaproteobacteria bacterium]|nr:type II toxin-antitoxin system VapB family antitoxin [Alphaproteobacteria bacterium]